MRFALILLLALFLAACGGGSDAYRVELEGFNEKRLQMKYDLRINPHTYDDGATGHVIKQDVRFATGDRKRMNQDVTTWVNDDYTSRRQEFRVESGSDVTNYTMWIEDGLIINEKVGPAGKSTERAPAEVRVYFTIPPQVYARDLTTPGQQKIYRHFSAIEMNYISTRYTFEGKVEVDVKGQMVEALRFKSKRKNAPDGTDIYLEPETFRMIKMEQYPMVFLPAS